MSLSCVPLLGPHGLYSPWNSLGQNTGVGSLSLLQGIFPTQRLNPGLPHCRWILYQLSHKGSPRILGWVAYPFSSGSSWPSNWTRVFHIAGGFFTNWAIREALQNSKTRVLCVCVCVCVISLCGHMHMCRHLYFVKNLHLVHMFKQVHIELQNLG